ncbi:MAG: inner membrane protein YpjD [Betaproteobacteria bacterium]
MILSTGSPVLAPGGGLLLVLVASGLYLLATVPAASWGRLSAVGLLGGFVLHALLLLTDIGGLGQQTPGARLGFGPVLSTAVWMVIAVYAVESRLLPVPVVRQWLGLAGIVAVLLAASFPGDPRIMHSPLAPLHFALGVGSYGLFGAAVLHGLWLDAAERRMRTAGAAARGDGRPPGMPLLQLERITFRFVEAGFIVLTATLLLGIVTSFSAPQGRWLEHKTVFSVLAWAVIGGLLLGRRVRGWRGRQATRWLYSGAVLLLLGYAGSRFVLEVVLNRGPA